MFTLESLLDIVGKYKYLAMFGVLFACGLGLPIPEEVTLIVSGLAVGSKTANFWFASLACVAGILAGDAFIFAMGRYHGRRFLESRPMRFLLSERRQEKINRLFAKRGSAAVFFARFVAGLRIGIYAYAGQHGMGWARFLLLDFLGAMVSGPTSIWIGAYAYSKFADSQETPQETAHEAAHEAKRMLHEGSYVLYTIIGIVILICVGHWWWSHRAERKASERQPDREPNASGPSTPEKVTSGVEAPSSRHAQEALRGEAPR